MSIQPPYTVFECSYRYYISKRLMHEAHKHQDGWRLPAETLERVVIVSIQELFKDQGRLVEELQLGTQRVEAFRNLGSGVIRLKDLLVNGEHYAKRTLLQDIIERIDISPKAITVTLDTGKLTEVLNIRSSEGIKPLILTAPIQLQRRGVEAKLIIANPRSDRKVDPDLCKLIAQARCGFDLLAAGKSANLDQLSAQIGLHRNTLSRILPLAFLAPEIVGQIIVGKQPPELTVKTLKALNPLPFCWKEQQKLLEIQTQI